ncbi:putative hydrolase YxeP [Bacteroidales bacterium Barb4]|nr:putative hydrolase YxeP [Bacteroidales bacterium Barb4]
MDKTILLEKIKNTDSYMRHVRAYLHENPELSSHEFETSRFLQAEVAKLGLPVTAVSQTGFYAVLDTGRPGRTIGLRADIDALPVPENPYNLIRKKQYVSKNEGVSHACGHDGHAAVLLGAVQVLHSLKEQLSGTIIFIFEAAEETAGGIDDMLAALSRFKIDAIYGSHLRASLQTGEISIGDGAVMAGMAAIEFDVVGVGGHGSRPDLSVNPVFAAAQVLNGIAVAWSNQLDVTKTVTLGITQIHGGTVNNVFPNSVYIGGTLRFFDREAGEKAVEVFKKVAASIAEAHNCSIVFRSRTGIVLEPVINDHALADIARKAVEELYPDKLVAGEKWFGGEPFSKYRSIAPSVYAFIGIDNAALGSGAEHHNDRFDMDEDALPYSLGAMTGFAVKLLEQDYA